MSMSNCFLNAVTVLLSFFSIGSKSFSPAHSGKSQTYLAIVLSRDVNFEIFPLDSEI